MPAGPNPQSAAFEILSADAASEMVYIQQDLQVVTFIQRKFYI